MEERNPDIEWKGNLSISNGREKKWKEVEYEDNEYRCNVHELRWEFYMK